MADDAAKQADATENASLKGGVLLLSAIAFVLGVLFLVGWYFDIAFFGNVWPGLLAVRPVSAVCMILSAAILASLNLRPGGIWLPRARLAGIALIEAVSLATAFVYQVTQAVGGDPAFVHTRFLNYVLDDPWRMAPLTAIQFAILGGALALVRGFGGSGILSGKRARQAAGVAHALALLSVMISHLAVVGYLHSVKPFHCLYGVAISLPTCIAALSIGLGVLCANTQTWLMRVIVSRRAGGAMARRLLPAIVVILLGIGWLRMRGEEQGLFTSPGGVGLAVVLNTSLFLVVVWLTARSSNRLDENRRGGELALRDSESRLRSALEAVLENQERLRHLAENVREVYWLGVPDGSKVLYVNPAYEHLWGRPCQSLYDNPRSWLESVVEKDRPAVVAALATPAFGRERTCLPEYRIVHPDGELRWIQAWSWPILDMDGTVHRIAGIAEDITQRKRTQEAEAKYRALVEESLVGVYLIQADKLAYVNPRLAEIFGYAKNEVDGLPVSDLVAPEDRALVAENVRLRMDGEIKSVHYAFRGLRKDKQVIDVEVLGSITDYGGAKAIIGTLQDITERKRAEEALRLSEENYHSLFENMLDGYAYCRMFYENGSPCDFVYLGVNDAFERLTGLKGVVGKKVSEVIPDLAQSTPDLLQAYGRVAQTGRPERFEIYLDTLRIWFAISVYSPRKEHFVAVFDNITARKRTEEMLKKTAAELARSNQDLEQFAYMTSHDLQEPLRMVRGHLEVVQRQLAGKLDDTAKESMFYAMDGAERMDALIRDLLAYSRVGRGGKGFTPTDMEAVLAYALGNLKASIAEAQATVTHDPLPTVKAETALISQLFQNLIGNAVKYRSKDVRPLIHVGAQREDRGWLFRVRDNGIGIKAEDRDRIFMIFQRLHTRQEYPGTGVGLAICKRIVEHHCGRIWVESEPGRGSTFCFTIPDRD